MNYKLIGLIMLFLAAFSFGALAEVDEGDFKLLFTPVYCNCDKDCESPKACLTAKTDEFVKDLSNRTDSKIAEGVKRGYNGICASLLLNNEPTVWPMTDSCQTWEGCNKDSECSEGFECVDHKCEPLPPECVKDSDCVTGKECKNSKCEEIENFCLSDADCLNGFRCLDKECLKIEVVPQCTKDSECKTGYQCANQECKKKPVDNGSRVVKLNLTQNKTDTQPIKYVKTNKTGGSTMDVVSVSIVSATVIVAGFFALMAWTAYLLQKKTFGK